MSSICIQKFEELSKSDLYAILRLRSEVFIVEQDCVYQDVDNKDQISLHVFLKKRERYHWLYKIISPWRLF